ncbi:Cof-type HAD-IIB family hydrolase [Macrococcus capreoli]
MKVFAVDMDGTFLNSQNDYDREMFKDLLELYKNQFYLIVASSNTHHHLKGFFSEQDLYYVASNGAVVMHKDEILHSAFINRNDISNAIQTLDDLKLYSYVISTIDASYVSLNAENAFIKRMHRYYDKLNAVSNLPLSKVTKITIEVDGTNFDKSEVITLLQHVCNNCAIVDSGFNCIDIIDKSTNKATGIEQVLTRIGKTVNDLYTFGDSDNDLEMLSMTAHGYAMENANSNVKRVAQHLCPSNDDNGVLLTMENILKEEL